MKRRTLGLVLAVLGAAALLLGVLSATAWRASNVVTMTAPRPQSPVAITDPGVLRMMEGDVTIAVNGDPNEPVSFVIGRGSDAEAWVGASPHQRITGAASWEDLAVEEVPLREGGTEDVPSPFDADGWQHAERGTQSAEGTWTPQDGDWRLLAVGDGSEAAPAVSLSWQREVTTPWLWPGVILGGLLLLAGLVLALTAPKKAQPAPSRTAARRSSAVRSAAAPSGETATARHRGGAVAERETRSQSGNESDGPPTVKLERPGRTEEDA